MNIKLWENEIPYLDIGADTPNNMTAYFIKTDKPLPCVVVFPGGGYKIRAPHEGEPIAKFFNARGLHAVVVDYRVYPNHFPAPLADAQRAIKLLRANAEKWNIDSDRIVTLGFSAGGHLSGACATLDDVTANRPGADSIDKYNARPNGAILCYAALSCKNDWGNYSCGENLLGKNRCKLESDYFTIHNHVSDKTPPIFMWQTSDDPTVNVMNALVFGEKLRNHNVPFELHIYPHGPHGIGLAEKYEDSKNWADLAADWIIRNI
jgi:acetyl esterase/lipase